MYISQQYFPFATVGTLKQNAVRPQGSQSSATPPRCAHLNSIITNTCVLHHHQAVLLQSRQVGQLTGAGAAYWPSRVRWWTTTGARLPPGPRSNTPPPRCPSRRCYCIIERVRDWSSSVQAQQGQGRLLDHAISHGNNA